MSGAAAATELLKESPTSQKLLILHTKTTEEAMETRLQEQNYWEKQCHMKKQGRQRVLFLFLRMKTIRITA